MRIRRQSKQVIMAVLNTIIACLGVYLILINTAIETYDTDIQLQPITYSEAGGTIIAHPGMAVDEPDTNLIAPDNPDKETTVMQPVPAADGKQSDAGEQASSAGKNKAAPVIIIAVILVGAILFGGVLFFIKYLRYRKHPRYTTTYEYEQLDDGLEPDDHDSKQIIDDNLPDKQAVDDNFGIEIDIPYIFNSGIHAVVSEGFAND